MNPTLSNGTPPTPSGAPGGSSSSRAFPAVSATTGGRWPAQAAVQLRSTGSYTTQTQVANWPSPIAVVASSSRCITRSGASSRVINVLATVRSCPMVAAALMPCPMTSPTTRATRPEESGTTSNQSPPTSLTTLLGR